MSARTLPRKTQRREVRAEFYAELIYRYGYDPTIRDRDKQRAEENVGFNLKGVSNSVQGDNRP
jgi:hypothetical protein